MGTVRAVPTVMRTEARRDPDDQGLGADTEMKEPLEPAVSNGLGDDELEGTQRAHRAMGVFQLLPQTVRGRRSVGVLLGHGACGALNSRGREQGRADLRLDQPACEVSHRRRY